MTCQFGGMPQPISLALAHFPEGRPTGLSGNAYGVSADGSIIVGNSDSGPYVYNESVFGGIVPLGTLFHQGGTSIPRGWTLRYIRDISGDGDAFVGSAINPDGDDEAFLITGLRTFIIPEPSRAAFLLLGTLAALLVRRR